jgi:ABC-2 type transport system ATP-binding protein
LLASIRHRIGEEELRHALERVGLDPADRRTYKKYSLGMKQWLGIAQAVMEAPRLLLLDEPTSALDEDGRQLVHQVIKEERDKGATVILASHDPEALETL